MRHRAPSLAIKAGGGGSNAYTDWLSRVAANSGTVSAGTQTKVRNLTSALISAGLWGKVLRMNVCVGDAAASMVPLKVAAGNAVDTAFGTGFAAAYSEATGWTGDGSSRYIDTGLQPAAVGGGAGYLRDDLTDGTPGYYLFGSQGASSSLVFALSFNRSTTSGTVAGSVSSRWGGATTGGADTTSTADAGFWHVNRTGTNFARLLKNGTTITSNTTSQTISLSGKSMYVMATNNNGTAAGFLENGKHLAGYCFESGMSGTECAALYTCWQDFQTAMGRQAGAVAGTTVTDASTNSPITGLSGKVTITFTITATTSAANNSIKVTDNNGIELGDIYGAVGDTVTMDLLTDTTSVSLAWNGSGTGSVTFTYTTA